MTDTNFHSIRIENLDAELLSTMAGGPLFSITVSVVWDEIDGGDDANV